LAVDGAGVAVWEWQARRDEISVSPIVETALGLDPGVLSTKLEGFCRYLHPADKERFLAVLTGLRENEGGSVRIDFRMRHLSNYYRWFSLDASSVPTTDRRSIRCCGLMRDITEDRRTHERLLHDAVHDNLTNLPNRELFLDRLERALLPVSDRPTPGLAVILIGIDKFKNVNAKFGMVIGDSLLLTVSRRLGHHLGPADTLARMGGDQFGVIVHEHQPRQLAMLAEKIRRSVRSPIQIAGQQVTLTGAIGISISGATRREPRELFKQAEIAMYRAKRNGADNVEIYRPELQSEEDQRATIEQDLRRAIENKQLTVSFQPIIYLPTEELAGFEALVRWQHPVMGQLDPVDFIPIAEESDLIVKLGAYVLGAAVQEATKWQEQLPRTDRPLFVSVNVSGRQLLTVELVQEVRRLASAGGLPPASLQLEVTETLVMDNPEQATDMLARLNEAGVRLALDDFGTGYSSLAYLQKFPIDTVKIDRELVRAAMETDGGAAIVRSIVALSHELGKTVVSEGVEAPEDVAFLRSLGCEYAQGFYYGEAMTPREVAELLKVVQKAERRAQGLMFSKTKSAARAKATSSQPRDTESKAKALPAASESPPARESRVPQAASATNGRGNGRSANGRNTNGRSTGPTAPGGRPMPPIPGAPGQRRTNGASAPNGASPNAGPKPRGPLPSEQPNAVSGATPPPNGLPRPRSAPTAAPSGSDLASVLAAATDGDAPSRSGLTETDGFEDLRTAPPVSQSAAVKPAPDASRPASRHPESLMTGAPPANGGPAPTKPQMPHERQPLSPVSTARDSDGVSVERLRSLPPGIAASLARLAGVDLDEDETSSGTDDDGRSS
ncbi:MAG: EAL domain-containing protein, partial [Pseudomonadota bacterium]